jgi:hypothetical protein
MLVHLLIAHMNYMFRPNWPSTVYELVLQSRSYKLTANAKGSFLSWHRPKAMNFFGFMVLLVDFSRSGEWRF